jgi:hypothetical protein
VTIELASLAQHGVISICPQEPTAGRRDTWGRIKAIYR